MENSLDLYARVESLIGFDEAYAGLHQQYVELISQLGGRKLLDVGCGSGGLLKLLHQKKIQAVGIDRSGAMVERCQNLGLDAKVCELSDVREKYDLVVAASDVLNYLDDTELKGFLSDVERVLEPQGHFLCDVNTFFGFEQVTQGTMANDMGDQFLVIDADFDEKILTTDITLFTHQEECYQKEQGRILQYYHSVEKLAKISSMEILRQMDICLFSEEEADKSVLVFQKA